MSEAAALKLSPPRCRVAHVWLTEEEFGLLSREAEHRRQHVDALAAELVVTGVLACAMERGEVA